MTFKFNIVGKAAIKKVLDTHEDKLINIIRDAYILHHNHESTNPPSYFLKFPQKLKSRIIALPAYIGGKFNVAGLKWIASNPENLNNNLPRASSVIILNDYKTGFPYACLEGSQISACRTAISAILAAETINKSRKCHKIGFIGNSFIAANIYHYLCSHEWQYDEIMLHDLELTQSKLMERNIKKNNASVRVTICNDPEELIKKCNMTIFATTAASPYILDTTLIAHKPILLNISLRDLSPELLLSSYNIVDDIDHVCRENTSPHLTEKACHHRDFINGTLADLILGNIELDDKRTTIFSPMGLGILDLALGDFIYEQLDIKDIVIIDDFFMVDQR